MRFLEQSRHDDLIVPLAISAALYVVFQTAPLLPETSVAMTLLVLGCALSALHPVIEQFEKGIFNDVLLGSLLIFEVVRELEIGPWYLLGAGIFVALAAMFWVFAEPTHRYGLRNTQRIAVLPTIVI